MKHARGLMEIMYCRKYVNVPVCVCFIVECSAAFKRRPSLSGRVLATDLQLRCFARIRRKLVLFTL